jgi:NAD dependent epimerase/dehydratase family enzyme
MRVVIAGASGFMGTAIRASYQADGSEVRTIGRGAADAGWDDREGMLRLIDRTDLLINLAGKSVNCRYGPVNRAEILRSRVATTAALGDAIATAAEPPPVWLNASTATIYRHAEDRPMTESTGEVGEGFSVGVARAWENAFFEPELPNTRRVAMRTAIVLGDGSALLPLLRLAALGMGGAHLDGRWPSTAARRRAGTYHAFRARGGRQHFSWVHLDDVVGSVRFLAEHPAMAGVVNVTSPNPSDDVTLMRTVRRVLGVPFGIPLPRWALELGSVAIRTETELVLKSRWVLPERLITAGYRFRYPDLEPALRQIVDARRAG